MKKCFFSALMIVLAAVAAEASEVEHLALGIYQEAGGDAVSDACRYAVGDVILNRVKDARFPSTVRGVLLQKGQYGNLSKTGLVWPARAKKSGEQRAVARARRIAHELISGQRHSPLRGRGYIWQAQFRQGRDVRKIDNMYFGR